MPAPVTRARRPPGVVALAALTALGGVLDLTVSILALAGDTARAEASTATIVALGLLGAGLIAAAIALWRGSNGARIVVSALAGLRVLEAIHQATTPEGSPATAVVVAAGAGITLALAWTPRADRWFQGDRERDLADALGGERRTVRARAARAAQLAVQTVVVAATIGLTPGVTADGWIAALLAAAAIALVTWVLQPVWLRIAGRFGWAGALTAALFANATTVGLALWLAPGVDVASPAWALVASWILTVLMTLVSWLFSVGTHDYLLVHATRMAMRGDRPEPDGVPGVLFVQLDGVSAPLLEQELRAGNLPTIARWIRGGTHTWTEWTARVPSTTPVSQAGILHGSSRGIPAFRWWDRELGRMVVANRPDDAALIEERVSDGRGLLADDGVSISNLFSGDAGRSFLTMSGMRGGERSLGPSRSYAAFFTHPAGFARAFTRTLGEMAKEVWQARRQEWRGVEPRVHRGGSYVALRGITNVLLRDLNVALVIEAMMEGARSIYVDFVDYDEIAHHAGVTRPESLASLYGLDAVLRTLEQVAGAGITPREYRIVLVSDHGQSQGATFLQRYGMTLEELVAAHTGGRALDTSHDEETWGRVRLLVSEAAAQDSVSGRAARRALRRREADAATDAGASSPDAGDGPALAVVGSGNLGGIWFTESPRPLTLSELEAEHPGLVEALATHPGIGFLVVRAASGPVAIGPRGLHRLATGEIEGEDPLAPFGPGAASDLARVAAFPEAPDIYVNSLHEPALDEVAAFEELVGCHGGLGGWQTRPLLVHPSEWSLDETLLEHGRLRGAEQVHLQLVRWLETLGHREGLRGQGDDAPRGVGEEAAATP
ncbi:alkaline phosphatase family protein [Demequina sp. SYSU T00192]|uniref:Alkaline phosphatase family protein n=1 Tax=Demequina litoralis TaxID=3051660 RepID=A0ABT8G7T6_9MICO|nr:alkaline phosphatase family protein [Demequina sp. SYSU T00192]MDN4475188.1 alkaline phosphatase family protein [Demequina sp. SYSU T00192]